jgi:hypothetical protein
MLERIEKFREYLDYVETHYNNVQKAWKELNEKCQNKGFSFISDDSIWAEIDENVKKHDLSKLSSKEFVQYRQFFFPANTEIKDKDLFLQGWAHHKEHNLHHWQSWTVHAQNSQVYFVEMLVDWIAMSYEFGDTAKEYYEKNSEDIFLPQWAYDLMYKIFNSIYP